MQVTTDQELDDALAETARLEAKLDTLENQCNNEIAAAKSATQAKAVTLVDGSAVRIPDRIRELYEGIAEYCRANKDTLIPNPKEKKSKAFTHGEIGWRAKRKSVQDVPTKEAEEAQQTLIKRMITAVITLFMTISIKGLKAIRADRLFNVKIEIKKAAVLDLYQNEQITEEQLEILGLKVTGGEDELWIKASSVTVSPHASAQNH